MKSRIATFLILLCLSNFVYCQFSKKQLRQLDVEIEQTYLIGDYNEVVSWCNTLLVNKAAISPSTFEYWLFSAYKLHDLKTSLTLYDIYHRELIDLKSYKKLSDDAYKKLDKLDQINSIFDRSKAIVYENKINEDQKIMVEKIIAIDSSFWQPYMMLGDINYFMHDYNGTIKVMEKLIKWQPANMRALQELGYSYFNIQQFDKALFYLSKVDEPYDYNVFLITLAYSHFNVEDYHKALWHSKEALKRTLTYDQKISAYSIKLNCERKLNRPQDEIKTLYKYLTIDTNSINKSNVRYTAELAIKTLGFEQSLANARNFHNQFPNNTNFLLLKIEHYPYHDENYFKEAVIDYDKLVNQTPNNRENYMSQGLYLFNSEHSKEQRDLAMTAFQNAYLLDSLDFEVHEYICRLYLWHDTKISKMYKQKAIANMRTVLKNQPNNGKAYLDLAKSFDLPTNGYGNNNIYLDSMLKYYNLALDCKADSFSVLVERRHVYRSLGQYEKSNADHLWIAEHTKYDETRRQCYYSMANNYMSLEQFKNAKEIIMRVKKEFPDDKHTSRWMKTINAQLN